MSSARREILPLNTNSRSQKLLYLLKKHNCKIATVFIGAICFICSILLWYKFPSHILQVLPIRFIPFTVILLFIGIYKKLPWLFLPFLWFLGAMIFLNILSFVLTINATYDYIKEYSYTSGRIYDSFDWILFFNVFGIPLTFCCYLITHRSYKLFVLKAINDYDYDDDDDIPNSQFRHPKFCFKYSVENGTIIICLLFAVCLSAIEIWTFISNNYEINYKTFFPIFCVVFAAILALCGKLKEKSWAFLPFLWSLETFVFLSSTIFINTFIATMKGENFRYNFEKFMMLNDVYPFKHWYKLMFFESVLQTYLQNIFVLKFVSFIICIIAVATTMWLFLIVHSCYMLIYGKQRERKLIRQNDSIEEC